MTQWNKETVMELLGESAAVALKYFETPRLDYKKDDSVVTQADREIEGLLAASLDRPKEGSWLLGEETLDGRTEDYIREALAGTAWIVDPIDGTASYAHHFPMWAISIGFAVRGEIREGAVYLPMEGEMLLSEGDAVYYGKVRPLSNARPELRLFTPRPAPVNEKTPIAIAQKSLRESRYTGRNAVQATNSAVFSLTHLMLGHYLGYKADLKLWDLAGSLALLNKLDFSCRFGNGGIFPSRITEEAYELLPAAGFDRWRVKGFPVFTASSGAFDYIVSCFEPR